MTSNVVSALGPGQKFRSLVNFADAFQSTSKNLSDLLVFPFLENIKVYESPNSTKATSYKNLHALAIDGSSRFASLCTQDIGLARQVITYTTTFQPMIEAVDIATYVSSLRDVVLNYADSARVTSEQSSKFFTEFSSFIDVLGNQINAMSDQLATVDQQITSESSELQEQDIGKCLYGILKGVFALDVDLSNAEAQIAALLQVTIDTIRGSFSRLFEDQARLQKVIIGLKAMHTQISTLKTLFSSLKANLLVVISDSSALLDVWDDIVTRMETVKGVIRKATPAEIQTLVANWNQTSSDADTFISSVSGRRPSAFAIRAAKVMAATPKIPVTQREIQLHRQLARLDPQGLLQTRLRSNPAFRQRFVRKQVLRIKLAALSSASPDEEKVKEVISPPDDAQKQIDTLATNTGQIIDQFDKLLQVPFLNELACTDPDDGKTPSDIRTMVTTFRKRYLDLQLETIPVARDLQTYATTQITLLPTVTTTETSDPLKMSLKQFLEINKGLTADYQAKANDLFNKSLTFQRSWDNAINSVNKSINECTANIDAWNKSVDEMTAEQKKATLFGALSIIGALVCFAAAAFFPGALLGAAGLLYTAIDQLQKAHRLSEAINDARIAIATDTKQKLEQILPFMQSIATSLTNVTQIWSTIVASLTNIGAFYTILGGPAGPNIWGVIEPKVIENWQSVENACVAYIHIVSSG